MLWCGQWYPKWQKDQGAKDMTTSVIRWHWSAAGFQ